VGDKRDAELAEEGARHSTEGHPGGRLAGARALEHVAGLVEAVLLHADEVGVAGAGAGQRRAASLGERLDIHGLGAHHVDPAVPLRVADTQGDRRSHGVTEADAGRDGQLVLFELLPRTTPVAELAALHVGLDALGAHRDAGRQPLENRDEFGAVGLTCGQPTKHG